MQTMSDFELDLNFLTDDEFHWEEDSACGSGELNELEDFGNAVQSDTGFG